MIDIAANIVEVRQRVAAAAKKSGRNPADIKIIAVTKTVPVEIIEQAVAAGITDLGENRVQEATPKIETLRPKYSKINWHMIGHLQRNKVKQVLAKFDLIQSLDSERLAQEINQQATIPVSVLVEVNVGGEASKTGLPVAEVISFLQNLPDFANINVTGLMTVAPWFSDPEKTRPYFAQLKQLSEKIKTLNLPHVTMQYLSMGMSADFVPAIEEGSNMVRLGRAIFGKRS
ncbi:YggS family pyridoxal phosphate-dependent enzyme [Candidatus Saganbacteria bacterium]|nr:YggS family pyridoxal phosphate-dependent enzyme [Candidatus Saganbacteria bacterium]